MYTKVNAQVGDLIKHHIHGNGVVTEIADRYIVIDFEGEKGWKAAKFAYPLITSGSKPLCETVFDGGVGTYSIQYMWFPKPYDAAGGNPVQDWRTIAGMTEQDAVMALEASITSLQSYEGGFIILAIEPIVSPFNE